MTGELGYTHALFGSYGTHLRTLAQKYDEKENGGNDNGLLDGNEITLFAKELKDKTGVDFNSLGLTQSVEKTVNNDFLNNQYDNKRIAYEIANSEKYRNYNSNSKSVFALNNGKLQTEKVKISYLSNEDYEAGRNKLKEASVEDLLAKAKNAEEQTSTSNYDPRDTFTKFFSWLFRKFK